MIKEEYFQIILSKISLTFSELRFIGSTLANDLKNKKEESSLKLNEVNYYLEIIVKNDEYFKRSLNTKISITDFKKNVQFKIDTISSFFREFEAVFFGTEEWYQRVVVLMDQLSKEANQLEMLLERE